MKVRTWKQSVGKALSQLVATTAELKTMLRNQSHILGVLMKDAAALKQNMIDLRALAARYLDLIIAKDQANATLQAQITTLVNQHVSDVAERDALNAAIADAVDDSQATEDQLRAGLPGVPPVGGTPLNLSYPNRTAFDAAVVAYTGPEAVTLDGTEVKSGTAPALAYFAHADGSIDTTADVVVTPPVTLASSFPSRADFDTAVAHSASAQEIDLDGAVVWAGTTPALTYFTQTDGSITTTPPAGPTA